MKLIRLFFKSALWTSWIVGSLLLMYLERPSRQRKQVQ